MKQIILIISCAALLMACNSQAKQAEMLQQQATLDSMNQVIAKQRAIDSVNAAQGYEERNSRIENGGYANQSTTVHKKGWSAKAKGAVIGGTVGIITGALVDKKNRGAGAVIGGVVGAGAGYGTGAVIDNKKKQQEQQ